MTPLGFGLSLGFSDLLMDASALPSSLPGLVAWGEAGDVSSVGDGNPVTTWTNKTGSGLDAAQATGANQPTYKASAINGLPAIKFVRASNHFLSFPTGFLSALNGVNGGTMAMICQPLSAPLASVVSLNISKNINVAARMSLGHTSGPVWRLSGLAGDDTSAVVVSGTSAPVAGTPILHLAVMDWLGGTAKLYINGAQEGGTTSFTPAAMAATNSFSASIGSRTDAATAYDGYIAAYAIWNKAYTRAQLDTILKRWASLYGITLS